MSYPFATCSERRNARDPSPLPYRDLRRDGLCPKVPGHVAFRLAQAELACDRRRSGLRQTDEHSRPAKTTGSRTVLAVVAPKNNDDEQALGDQFFTALGLPLRGHWSTRKPKLMGHLHQYGTQCLIVDDAHDLSLEHLMLIKEVTDQGHLQYGHPLGLCLVAAWASRGLRVPARNALLADMVPASVYGRAYGFERMMDNLGGHWRTAAGTWIGLACWRADCHSPLGHSGRAGRACHPLRHSPSPSRDQSGTYPAQDHRSSAPAWTVRAGVARRQSL